MKRITMAFALFAGIALTTSDVDAAPRVNIPPPHAAVPVTQPAPTYRPPVVVAPAKPKPSLPKVDPRKNAVEQRQAALKRQIDQGARSGALTRSEERKLREENDKLERQIRQAFMDDRRIDNRELARIDQAQDKLERNIRAEMRDRQMRS